MKPADLAGDVLVVLPEAARIALMLVIPVLVAVVLIIGCDLLSVAPRRIRRWRMERKAVRVLLRHRRARGAERARQDVAVQAETRSFQSWDADLDRVWPENVVPFERKTSAEVIPLATRVMDSDGIGGAA